MEYRIGMEVPKSTQTRWLSRDDNYINAIITAPKSSLRMRRSIWLGDLFVLSQLPSVARESTVSPRPQRKKYSSRAAIECNRYGGLLTLAGPLAHYMFRVQC